MKNPNPMNKILTILIVDPHVPYRAMLADLLKNLNEEETICNKATVSNIVQHYTTKLDHVSIIRIATLYSTFGLASIEKIQSSADMQACEATLKQLDVDAYLTTTTPANELLPIVKRVCSIKRVASFVA